MPNLTLPCSAAVTPTSPSPDPLSDFAPQQIGSGAPLTAAPLCPPALLKAHAAFIATDMRFAAASRLLASLSRTDQGLPAGIHISRFQDGRTRRSRAGWRLRPDAARAGAAFLTPAIARFVFKALVLREPGSLWDETKIRSNLLSSQNLCLNLFVPMALDLELATAVWRRLLPDFVYSITSLRFESSPGRNDPLWLEDGTAFDAVLDVITPDGETAFVAIELKYIENFAGPAATSRPRYQAAAHAAELFIDPDAPELYRAGLEQFRREHCLAQLMVQRGLAARGLFVLAGPRLHVRLTAAAQGYRAHLVDPDGTAEQRVGFNHITVEAILGALSAAGAGEHAQALHRRFLDFERVAALALGDDFPTPPAAPVPLLRLPPPASPDVVLGESDGTTVTTATISSSARRRHTDVGQHPASSQQRQAAQRTRQLAMARRSRRRRSPTQPGTEVR